MSQKKSFQYGIEISQIRVKENSWVLKCLLMNTRWSWNVKSQLFNANTISSDVEFHHIIIFIINSIKIIPIWEKITFDESQVWNKVSAAHIANVLYCYHFRIFFFLSRTFSYSLIFITLTFVSVFFCIHNEILFPIL